MFEICLSGYHFLLFIGTNEAPALQLPLGLLTSLLQRSPSPQRWSLSLHSAKTFANQYCQDLEEGYIPDKLYASANKKSIMDSTCRKCTYQATVTSNRDPERSWGKVFFFNCYCLYVAMTSATQVQPNAAINDYKESDLVQNPCTRTDADFIIWPVAKSRKKKKPASVDVLYSR